MTQWKKFCFSDRLFTIILCFILKMARKLLLYFGVNLLSKSLVMILLEELPLHSEKCISYMYTAWWILTSVFICMWAFYLHVTATRLGNRFSKFESSINFESRDKGHLLKFFSLNYKEIISLLCVCISLFIMSDSLGPIGLLGLAPLS